MKKILLLSLIASFSYGQSTILTPGSGEFKSEKIIIGGLSTSNEGKLQINGNNSGLGAYINTEGSYSDMSTGLKVITENNQLMNLGVDVNVGGAIENNGLKIYGANLNERGVGVNIDLIQLNDMGTLIGQITNVIHNRSGDGINTYGNFVNVNGNGNNSKKGIYVLTNGGGNKDGIHSLILEGGATSNENVAGKFENTAPNSNSNYGIKTKALNGLLNYGIHSTARGENSYAGYFDGLVWNNGDVVNISYTKLGVNAPKIQQKEITGTMPAANGSQNFPHDLTDANIVSVSILANVSGQYIPPNYTGAATLEYNYYIASDRIYILNKNGNSAALAGVPFKALITYKE